MRTTLLLLFSLAIFSQRASLCLAEAKWRVGFILPLSGDGAYLGTATRHGVELALEELSAQERARFEIMFEDDMLIPSRTVSSYNKLTSVHAVDAVVCVGSSTCKAVAPMADQKAIPLIALATDRLVSRGRTYVVNLYTSAEEEAAAAVAEARRRGYKEVAHITAIQDFFLAVSDAFLKRAAGSISSPLTEEVSPENKDFRSFLTKVARRPSIDAIAVALMPGQAGLFARQAREMGITLPLFGFELFEDKNEVRLSGGALIGQWYVNIDEPEEPFKKRFLARYPEEAPSFLATGWDALMLLNKAFTQGHSRAEINEFLHRVRDFSGAMGTYSADGDNGYTIPAVVKMVTKEQFVTLPEPR